MKQTAHTVQFYRQFEPDLPTEYEQNHPDMKPPPAPLTADMALRGWPDHHGLVSHATVYATDPSDAAQRFASCTAGSNAEAVGPWWTDGNVTLRDAMRRDCQVEIGDVLAAGTHGMVHLYAVVGRDNRHLTLDSASLDPPHEQGSVFTVHHEEEVMDAERRRLLLHYDRRTSDAETLTEQGLNDLLDACGTMTAALLKDYRLPLGLLDAQHPVRKRMTDLLRTTSDLVATLKCDNLNPGDCQGELRYIAHRAGIQRDLDGREPAMNPEPADVTAAAVPIYTDPPRELDMPLRA